MISRQQAHNIILAVGDDYTAVLTIGSVSVALSPNDLFDLASVTATVYREVKEYADEQECERLVQPDA